MRWVGGRRKEGREGGREGGKEGRTGGGEDARARESGEAFKHLVRGKENDE